MDMDEVDAQGRRGPVVERRMQRMLRGLTALFAVCVMALAVSLFFNVRGTTTWNPLGLYPQQVVVNPLVGPKDQVRVEAIKCVNAPEPVKVKGTLQWQSVQPAGSVIVVMADGAATRYPKGWNAIPATVPRPDKRGCSKFTYSNPLPDAVVIRSSEVCRASNGTLAASWRIAGVETPVDHERVGIPRPWQSDIITVRCDG